MIIDSQSPRVDAELLREKLPGIASWMPHQLAIIDSARRYEQNEIPGISSNICAIVAPPGSGKTAIIAAMAATFEEPKKSIIVGASATVCGSRSIVVYDEHEHEHADAGGNGKTLIVVPKPIVRQWKSELVKYGLPQSDVVFAWDNPSFTRINSRASYDAAKVVVMADTFLHNYRCVLNTTIYGTERWSRVIVDEWHTILSSVPRFLSVFTWLVSASTGKAWTNRKNESLVSDVPFALLSRFTSALVMNARTPIDERQQDVSFDPQNIMSDIEYTGIRNALARVSANESACIDAATIVLRDEFAQESMSLPQPVMHTHVCQMDAVANFVSQYVPALRELVDAGAAASDIRENMLGAADDAEDSDSDANPQQTQSVFDKVLEIIDRDIAKENAIIAYHEALAHSGGAQSARERLRVLQQRRARVVEAMESETTCPICMEDDLPADQMVALGCSSTHFMCASCTLGLMETAAASWREAGGQRRCPMCRERLENLIMPSPRGGAGTTMSRTPISKIEKCVDLVEKSEGPAIVYTSHWSMVSRVTDVLQSKGIATERLNMTGSVDRIVREFNDGKIKVLVLDPSNPTGLNLQKASTVVIMNEISPQVTQQVIGRAQRVGRTGELHVHSLVYEPNI